MKREKDKEGTFYLLSIATYLPQAKPMKVGTRNGPELDHNPKFDMKIAGSWLRH